METPSDLIQSPGGDETLEYVEDCEGSRYLLRIRADGEHFDARLERGEELVGYASARITTPNKMLLCDIVVLPNLARTYHVVATNPLGGLPWRPAASYRGRGLGTLLLNALVTYGRSCGISTIEGIVVDKDLDDNPELLAWYEKRGFAVDPPASDDLGVAARLRMEIGRGTQS